MNPAIGSFVCLSRPGSRPHVAQVELIRRSGDTEVYFCRQYNNSIIAYEPDDVNVTCQQATTDQLMTFYSQRADYFIGQYKKAKEEIRACRTKWAELALYQASVGRD